MFVFIEWASARVPPTPLLGSWAEGGWSISNPVTSQIFERETWFLSTQLAPTWAFLGLCSLFSLANWASCPEGSDSVRYSLSSDNHPFWSATFLALTKEKKRNRWFQTSHFRKIWLKILQGFRRIFGWTSHQAVGMPSVYRTWRRRGRGCGFRGVFFTWTPHFYFTLNQWYISHTL